MIGGAGICPAQVTDRWGRRLLEVLEQRDRDLEREGHIELPAIKGENRRFERFAGDDRVFDSLEIGDGPYPIIGVFDAPMIRSSA